MKKLLAVLLAVLMLVSLSVPAFADGEELCDIPMPETGLTFHIPWGYLTGENTLGKLMIGVAEELAYNAGIYYTQIEYMRNGEEDDYEHYAPYLTFICLRSNCDQAMLSSPDFLDMLPSVGWNELATIGDYTHYVIIGTDEIKADFTDDELSEYFSLLDNVEDIIQTTDYYEPEAPHSEMTGQTISFQTKDLDGNPVNSADLFAANRITMLNMWETSCPHCIKELPDLAQIHERLQSMGCGIVGLLYDSYDPEAIEEAKQILADAGTPYITIQSPDNFDDLFTIQGFPISFFIDSNGQILGTPIEGAQVDRYEMAIQDLLGGGGQAESAPADAAPGDGSSFGGGKPYMATVGTMKVANVFASAPDTDTPYRIICVDESGAPVAGAKVQFCSDMQCMIGTTDDNGVAEFDEEPGHYTVHLLKPPEGFAKDKTEYEAPAVPGDVTIVVKAG